MKTDPFSDAWAFLVGTTPDHVSLGLLRYPFVASYASVDFLPAIKGLMNG